MENRSCMSYVHHLRKQLTCPPVIPVAAGISIHTFVDPEDIDAWLVLRERATADLAPAVRPWSHDDFMQEMTGQPWWRADWTWLATLNPKLADELRLAGPARRSSPTVDDHENGARLIGAVTLAIRGGRQMRVPVIHWLLVDPAYTRRGIGSLLVSLLERAAWDAGWREVGLETHAGWSAAVAFYHSLGYT
jgi:GNAT superfamily N-acetyltransferase